MDTAPFLTQLTWLFVLALPVASIAWTITHEEIFREPREWAISDLGDSVKIPLGTLPESLEKLSKDDEIVVYCRTGGRSGNAVAFLLEHGFEKVRNLAGGINRWADRIDKSLPRY